MEDNHDDIYELEQDVSLKGYKTPHEVMEHKYYVEHNGDWKSYLNSIEWDTWCKRYTPAEQAERLIEINKRKAEVELKNHPFNKFL